MLSVHQRKELVELRKIARSKGGECISRFYVNSKTKLQFRCSKGHKWLATPSKIKIGQWCPDCGGSKRLTIDLMKKTAKERGGECLSSMYVNGKTKLQWKCEKGHTWWAIPNSISRGSWCQQCHGNYKHTIEMMHELAKKRGGKCLSDTYVNNSTELLWECSDGHQFKANANRVRSSGRWCPICSSSLGERICREFFEQIFEREFPKSYPDWLINEEGNRMELDGFCEELQLAFEHQGEQHYSLNTHFIQSEDKLLRRINLDKLKEEICISNDVKLIHVKEISPPIKVSEIKREIHSSLSSKKVPIPNDFDSKSINLDKAYISRNLKELQDIAEYRGGIYCEKVYKGALEPVRWQCSLKHRWLATPSSIKSGSWCPICSYVLRADEKRLDIQEMHEIAETRGGRCLSKKYTNTNTKLLWECAMGHRWLATPGNVKSGKWCRECAGIKELTIDEMNEIAASMGGKCLSIEYINSKSKLLWQCSHGHKWEATPSPIKNGHWCPICAGNRKLTLEDMKQLASKRGGCCLSKNYVNSGTNLLWECDQGHQWSATYDNVKKGTWCKICSKKRAGLRKRLTIEEMQTIARERGGNCLSKKYTNTQTKLLWECKKGHQWEATPGNIKNGRWCPVCARKNSG